MRQPTSDEWNLICAEFDALVELAPGEQASRLDAAALDPFVDEQVRTLLQAARADGVLDGSPGSAAAEAEDYASLAPGTLVGAFRIERLIGRGGMGEVYLAERTESGFSQRVALKLLRPEAAGRNTLFEAERALLATLEHRGIARLIDGGRAPDGRAYMAIEYVEGQEIDAWCAANKTDLAERLRLFVEICEAVAYAHGRLIVHRDLKPSNILVDGDGHARLLDFGVARLIDDSDGRTATQALLTPDYAAPEQFEARTPTVATDIYALGAVLFHLLTGRSPWRDETSSLPLVIRRILSEDPPRPSQVAAEAEAPLVPPARLRGDLDAIVLKAMRRAPDSRYANVAELADDVRRHLAFEPVRARSGSERYRFARFVRRHRIAVAAGAALLLAVLVGAGGIAWQARQTAIERDIARAEARRQEAVNRMVTLMFRNASESGRANDATAHELLNRAARDYLATLDANAPETADTVLALVTLYQLIEDMTGADALASRALDAGVGNNDPVARARLQLALGQTRAVTSRLDEARALLDQSDPVWASDPERFRIERMESIAARAAILRNAGDREGGIRLLADSLAEAEQTYADDPRELLIRYANLAIHYLEANRLDEAADIITRGEAAVARTGSEALPPALALSQMRGGLLSRQGDTAGAQRVFRQTADRRRAASGPSAGLALDLLQYGRMSITLQQGEEAWRALDEASGLARTFLGAESPVTQQIEVARAQAAAMLGRADEADRIVAAAEPLARRTGPQSLEYGMFVLSRADVRVLQRRLDQAIADLEQAEAVFRQHGSAGQFFIERGQQLRAAIERARAGD